MFAGALVVGGSHAAATCAPTASCRSRPQGCSPALTAWWGPGGASLRRGSRSIVRGFTPGATAAQVVAGVLLVVAADRASRVALDGGDGPRRGGRARTAAPAGRRQVVPTL